jgi:hypothetical protein
VRGGLVRDAALGINGAGAGIVRVLVPPVAVAV